MYFANYEKFIKGDNYSNILLIFILYLHELIIIILVTEKVFHHLVYH